VAAALGGLMWMLIGYNTFWFSTGTFMGASVFAPLALLGIQLGLTRRSFKPLALGGLSMGLIILGSHGQHALHVMIFLSLWLVVSWIRDRDARGFILRGGAIFIAAAVGTGMAAILTQLDSVLNGLRVPGEDARMHYAMPWELPTYLAGLALGKVCYPPDGLLRSEFTIYAGASGFMLAVAGAFRGFRDPWIRYLSLFAVTALLVAFLKPLAELALLIPFLNLSMPARWVYVFGLCLTLLAAAGLDELRQDPSKTARLLLIPAGLSLSLLAFYTAHGAVAETLVGLALAAGMILTAARPRVTLAFCFAAILVDLLPNFVLFNRPADPAPLESSVRFEDAAPGPWRALGSIRLQDGPPDANLWSLSIGNNLLALNGIEAMMGYESIAPLSTVQYCIATSGPRSVVGSGRVLVVANLDSRLLDVANMKYLYWPFSLELEPRYRKKETRGPLTLYENPTALPRAFLVSRAVLANESEAARLLQSADHDPRTTVVLLDTPQLPRTGEGGGAVAWIARASDRFELKVEAKADSILVVSDTFYPGWEAEVDGKEAPILRANLAFRAVAVPAGTHSVTMRFRPSSARNGLIVTALTIIGVLGFCVLRKKSAS
ncbi:MAG: YfhO family protein, partial [Planctomycetes bacterium]|nr:YfhO family protein [Planctomycetota bacterium]